MSSSKLYVGNFTYDTTEVHDRGALRAARFGDFGSPYH